MRRLLVNRVWYGIGFGLIPFLVLVLGYLNIHPEIFRSVPSVESFSNLRVFPQSAIAWSETDKKDPPIQFVMSNHKPLRLSTAKPKIDSFWSLWNTPGSYLEYGWEYEVKNLTSKRRKITVTYKLVGDYGEIFSQNSEEKIAEPNETIKIEGTHKIDYDLVKFVKGSTWSVRNTLN